MLDAASPSPGSTPGTSADALPPDPVVAAVVPCLDEVETLARCLRSIREQTPPVDRIIVVDNGSTDGSLAVAHDLADLVVSSTGRLGAVRNLGARCAPAADVLVFVDADCELHHDWLAVALEELATVDVVGARLDAPADSSWVARRWGAVTSARAHDGSAASTGNVAIRARTFHRLGGFDESLPTTEDVDLSRRIVAGGGAVRLSPRLGATHHGYPETLRAFVRRERWHTSTPGWWDVMSPRSKGLVALAGAWGTTGALALTRAGSRRSPWPLAAWLGASALGVPALGLLTGSSPRTAPADGVLMSIWAATRASRLPRELTRRNA